jgi:hypothetical protein
LKKDYDKRGIRNNGDGEQGNESLGHKGCKYPDHPVSSGYGVALAQDNTVA